MSPAPLEVTLCFNPTCSDPHNLAAAQTCRSCGADLQLQSRYRAVQLLGQGGSGRTWLVQDGASMPPHFCVVKQLAGAALPMQAGTQRPAQLPAVLGSFDQAGYSYLVQEYIEGKSLAAVLAERGSLTATEIWELLSGLLPGLQLIHEQGLIHGDIKPENLILRRPEITAEHLVLVDFATPARTASEQAEKVVGSPEYAAPEQLVGQVIAASDLYSLGVTCIHLLTGVRPFNLFDFASGQWVWRDYWEGAKSQSDLNLAAILDQLIEPALKNRLASVAAAIATFNLLKRPKIAVAVPAPTYSWQCYATLTGHSGLFASVMAVAIAPDQPILASASEDATVRLWDLSTGAALSVLHGHQKSVHAVAFQPQPPTRLASGGRDRTLRIWDLTQAQPICCLSGHQHEINALAYSPDGRLLASGSSDKTIKLWDAATGELRATLGGHRLAVKAIAFSPIAPILVSASADATVKVWDLTHLKLLQTLQQHTATVRAIAFSPDGSLLATGGEDRSIHLWSTQLWQKIRTLSGHPWAISALAFDAAGTVLFSGSWDQTIKAWQTATGQEEMVLRGHTQSVTCIALAGDVLVSGSQDQTLRLWKRLNSSKLP